MAFALAYPWRCQRPDGVWERAMCFMCERPRHADLRKCQVPLDGGTWRCLWEGRHSRRLKSLTLTS